MTFTDDIYALVVDDEVRHAELAAGQLESSSDHLSTEYVTSGEEALEYLESNRSVDAVVADYSMPDMNGLELLEEVNSSYDVPFIIFTGKGCEETAMHALRKGAEDYVKKGGVKSLEKLSNRVENAAIKHRAEQELSILKSGIDNAGHAVQVTDSDGNILYVNEALEEETGYSEAELLGATPAIAKSGHHDEEFYREMWQSIKQGEIWEGEILNEDRNGEEYWIHQTISPITNEQGEIDYLIAVNTDITEKKSLQERRELLNSMLRHDVGNDIQTVTGYIELLQNTELTETQQEYVNAIHESVEQSHELLHGVRGLLRSDPESASEEINLKETVEEVLERKGSLAETRGVDVEAELDEDEEYTVEAGPLLDQALANLVENAIVHPDEVETVRVGAEQTDEFIKLYVADDGEGLPEDFSFSKGDKGEESDGTGVGTWLAKEIAEAYGDGIEAGESEEGGAEFVFRLEDENVSW